MEAPLANIMTVLNIAKLFLSQKFELQLIRFFEDSGRNLTTWFL